MKLQAVSSTMLLIAFVALIVGGVVGYYFAPAKTTTPTQKSSTETFTPSETMVKEQVKYLNEYLKELSSMAGSPAPELEYRSASYDEEIGLIVVKAFEKTSSQDVTLYLTKNYRFVGYQEPVNLKSVVNEVKQQKQLQKQQETEVKGNIEDDDPYKGDENAPVTIVEFSDFQCPFCKKFYQETLSQLIKDYVDTGKVKLVYRDFPLSFHQYAQKAAEAAECADEQGKFWEMHNKLFESEDLSVDSLKKYAEELGLDTEQFNSCLDSGKYAEEVQKDFNDGVSLGVTGTPTFFINGEKVVGAQPYSVIKQVIDSKLKESGSG